MLRNWVGPIVLAVILALFIRYFWLTPLAINGNSMLPTIHSGDEVLLRHYGKISRFDVVTFKTQSGETYIKRVIGVPGDEITYKDNTLYVDQKPVPEEYSKTKITGKTSDLSMEELFGVRRIPKNKYFVLGDNRQISRDSRTLGLIDGSQITGRAWIVYWPLWHFKVL